MHGLVDVRANLIAEVVQELITLTCPQLHVQALRADSANKYGEGIRVAKAMAEKRLHMLTPSKPARSPLQISSIILGAVKLVRQDLSSTDTGYVYVGLRVDIVSIGTDPISHSDSSPVTLVRTSVYRDRKSVGLRGAIHLIRRLCRETIRKGINVDVILKENGPLYNRGLSAGVNVITNHNGPRPVRRKIVSIGMARNYKSSYLPRRYQLPTSNLATSQEGPTQNKRAAPGGDRGEFRISNYTAYGEGDAFDSDRTAGRPRRRRLTLTYTGVASHKCGHLGLLGYFLFYY
ncbi:unnamed protein product [Haemonchus placei]|uniref:N-acetyltransferase domain-containing protein n=1 Tax=Haemonchus placei TaxID=6290 RepID=A0A0N4WEA5_HAEPC|nr:unnamed protein product [Haemonchus placei]